MIAMALSNEPKLLIADEPTTALDVTVQAQILQLIARLQRELGMAVVLITHDLGVVAEVTDRIVVMYAGRIVEDAATDKIFRAPEHPVHVGPAAVDPAARPLARRAADPDRRPAAEPDQLSPAAAPSTPGARTCATAIAASSRSWSRCPTIRGIASRACSRAACASSIWAELRAGKDPQQARAAVAARGGAGMSEALVEVRDLVKHFPLTRGIVFQKKVGAVHAVDGVSFDVLRGETLGIVGETGCGKTTTARLMMRLLEPTSGTINFEGEDVTHLRKRKLKPLRREVQMIFQDPYSSLNPRKTVGAIIGAPFAIQGLEKGSDQRRRAVQEMMEQVGLNPEHYNRYPHEFSGGQRQRIGVARALALKPKLIIADEPVSALDVSIQAQILNLLRQLQKDLGLTLVLIAHDLSVVKHMCDRVAVMYLGKIVEFADNDALYGRPRHPYTGALLSAVPVPEPRLREQPPRRGAERRRPEPHQSAARLPVPSAVPEGAGDLRA